jgi:hypothetical protein
MVGRVPPSITGGGASNGNVGVSLASGAVVTGSATGIKIDGFGSIITLTGSPIEAGGANSNGNVGVLAQNSGPANLIDTTIRTTGTGQSGGTQGVRA